MATRRTRVSTFDAPIPTPAERRAAGKAWRTQRPRAELGGWDPPSSRFDPVALIAESNSTRVPELVPLRHQRMALSPFTFLRGSALVMAHDLASQPSTGIDVQLCGDAHLSNFGIYASPERRLVFDLNDFDETAPGPFEWDVKRLAASLVVAGRDNGFDRIECRRAVLRGVGAYRDWIERYSTRTHLDVWYSHIDVNELVDMIRSAAGRRQASRQLEKVAAKNHLKAFTKLTTVVDGRQQIVDDPPIVVRFDAPELRERLEQVLGGYRASLTADRRALFDRYRFVDFARKVVGVGSVGTRCWIVLLQGPNGGPLFLQVKEARGASPDLALGRRGPRHAGRRVVEGQRMLQATGDVLLGWATDDATGIDYFVRQMWDSKGSVDVAGMAPKALALYADFCGWALARSHARTGDSVTISGYVGASERFGEVMADFAEAYADQTERDHAAFVAAIADGRLPSVPD
jgi:uncharacterized protein (DUF2252 family)